MLCYINPGDYMRILFIRHADPDYATDSLTTEGHQEARLLGEFLKNKELGHLYVSPMGRARKTLEYILNAKGINDYTVLDWVHEFEPIVDMNNGELRHAYDPENIGPDGHIFPRISWDMYPGTMPE